MSFSNALKFIYSCTREGRWCCCYPPKIFFKNNKEKNASMPELIKSKPRENRRCSDCVPARPRCASNEERQNKHKRCRSFHFFFICVHIDGAVTQKRAKGVGGGGINWLNMFTRCNIHGRQRLSCAVSLLQQGRDTGTEGQGTAKINKISG